MKAKTTEKATGKEQTHPIRENLNIEYDRWLEINKIVTTTTSSSKTWGEVLVSLSENAELAGVEFVLAGGIFAENRFRKLRIIPDGAGIGIGGIATTLDQRDVRARSAYFPVDAVVEPLGIPPARLFPIKGVAFAMPQTGLHLAEKLSLAYARWQNPDSDTREITALGYLTVAYGLVAASNGERYTVWSGTDPEWGGMPA